VDDPAVRTTDVVSLTVLDLWLQSTKQHDIGVALAGDPDLVIRTSADRGPLHHEIERFNAPTAVEPWVFSL